MINRNTFKFVDPVCLTELASNNFTGIPLSLDVNSTIIVKEKKNLHMHFRVIAAVTTVLMHDTAC